MIHQNILTNALLVLATVRLRLQPRNKLTLRLMVPFTSVAHPRTWSRQESRGSFNWTFQFSGRMAPLLAKQVDHKEGMNSSAGASQTDVFPRVGAFQRDGESGAIPHLLSGVTQPTSTKDASSPFGERSTSQKSSLVAVKDDWHIPVSHVARWLWTAATTSLGVESASRFPERFLSAMPVQRLQKLQDHGIVVPWALPCHAES